MVKPSGLLPAREQHSRWPRKKASSILLSCHLRLPQCPAKHALRMCFVEQKQGWHEPLISVSSHSTRRGRICSVSAQIPEALRDGLGVRETRLLTFAEEREHGGGESGAERPRLGCANVGLLEARE